MSKKKIARKSGRTKPAKSPAETPALVAWDAVQHNLRAIETLLGEALTSYGMVRQGVGRASVAYLPDVLADIAIRLHSVRTFLSLPKDADIAKLIEVRS